MIAGQSPRYAWKPNEHGAARTIDEALQIARSHGVAIPDDVVFFVDEDGALDRETTARGPKVTKGQGEPVRWSDFLNRFGQVPFVIRPDVLESDEAIVAVIAHEMYELSCLRPMLVRGTFPIEYFLAETTPGNPGNLHDKAWDVADRLVAKMRGEELP
jgi:hypothetical protein